jgi:4-hydroxy-tetrahydrodipicolinate synthase
MQTLPLLRRLPEMSAMKLRGAIPANVLPFTPDYAIDLVSYRRHLDWLASVPGVGGVTCNGHAGEVASLSREERRQAAAVAVEVVAGRVPVVAGVYAESWREAVALAGDAVAEGVDALLVFPVPALALGGDPKMAYQHFDRIAQATDCPLVVFAYPQWTNLAYDQELLARICAIPTVCAVKDWTLDIGVYERNLHTVKSVRSDIAMLSSFSTNLLPSLIAGADGILSGHGSVICDIHVELLAAVAGHDLDTARAIYQRVQQLTQAVYRAPMGNMYTRMKHQLVTLGRISSPTVRPPLTTLHETEIGQLTASLRTAGLLNGRQVRTDQRLPVRNGAPLDSS